MQLQGTDVLYANIQTGYWLSCQGEEMWEQVRCMWWGTEQIERGKCHRMRQRIFERNRERKLCEAAVKVNVSCEKIPKDAILSVGGWTFRPLNCLTSFSVITCLSDTEGAVVATFESGKKNNTECFYLSLCQTIVSASANACETMTTQGQSAQSKAI